MGKISETANAKFERIKLGYLDIRRDHRFKIWSERMTRNGLDLEGTTNKFLPKIKRFLPPSCLSNETIQI